VVSLPPGMELDPSPMPCPGGYTLDAYCKYRATHHKWTPQYPSYGESAYGQTYGECSSDLRKAGWILHRDGTATCPKCAAALKEQTTCTS
jgi:hypothetical protein